MAPYGSCSVRVSRPKSSTTPISPERDTATSALLVLTVLMWWKRSTPLCAPRRCWLRPPARRRADVEGTHGSCVPGSPIDCAAIDAHRLAIEIVRRAPDPVRSSAAHPVARFAGDRGAHLDLVDALGLERRTSFSSSSVPFSISTSLPPGLTMSSAITRRARARRGPPRRRRLRLPHPPPGECAGPGVTEVDCAPRTDLR